MNKQTKSETTDVELKLSSIVKIGQILANNVVPKKGHHGDVGSAIDFIEDFINVASKETGGKDAIFNISEIIEPKPTESQKKEKPING